MGKSVNEPEILRTTEVLPETLQEPVKLLSHTLRLSPRATKRCSTAVNMEIKYRKRQRR